MNKTITILLVLLVILLGLAVGLEFFDGKDAKTDDTSKSPETQQAADEQIPAEPENISSEILQEGDAENEQAVEAGNKITLHYTGWLADGTKFDSSYDAGQPFAITAGVGQVIAGFDQGILGMKVGEKRKLIIPSRLAYGAQGITDVIPPYSTLTFEVELISIDTANTAAEGDAETTTETESTSLSPVGENTGEATATRVYNEAEAEFTHTLTATLASPDEGYYYEGWLSDGEDVISTGRLGAEGEEYLLTYTSAEDLISYNEVIITLESDSDEEPGAHVLEGSF